MGTRKIYFQIMNQVETKNISYHTKGSRRLLYSVSKKCACSELKIQGECLAQGCQWITYPHNSYSYCQKFKPNCKKASVQSDCDEISGCAWRSTNVCEEFTKCEDYEVSTPKACKQKDSTRTDGTEYSGIISCKTSKILCTSQKLYAYCSPEKEGQCGSQLEKSEEEKIFSSCSDIDDVNLCNQHCIWNYSLLSCQALTCSDINDINKCTYVWENNLQSLKICYPEKFCTEAISVGFLSEGNCFVNTAGTHMWKANACKACTGIELLENQESNDNKEGEEKEESEDCENNEEQDQKHDQDQNGNSNYLLTASTRCACSELTVQADCTTNRCAWVTINSVSSCEAVTATVACTAEAQVDCDRVNGCAWSNANACSGFTKCTDYTVTKAGQCNQKDSTCSDGTASGTSIPCVTTPAPTCSTLTSTTCQGAQTDGKVCSYQNSVCTAYDVSSCSVIKVQDLCIGYGCVWSRSACAAQTCASITNTTKCTFVMGNDFKSVNICAVSGTACVDAKDTSALTSVTCNSNTHNTYKWNGSSCSACTGESSSQLLFAIISCIAVILL